MHIVYDGRVIDFPSSGLGRFTAELLVALLDSATGPEVRVDVLVAPRLIRDGDDPFVQRLVPHIASGRCALHQVKTPAISVDQQWVIPRVTRALGGDLYFYPHFDVPASVGIPFVFVVHDLIPLKMPDYIRGRFPRLKQEYFKACIRRGLRRSRRCVAVSKTTRADLLAQFGAKWAAKVEVSYEGSSLDTAAVDHALRHQLGVNGQYLLYVGTRRPNKNLRFMIDMFRAMRQSGYRGQLVMAGSLRNFGFDVDEYAAAVDGVKILGPVTDDQLASLYAGMDALLFLSTYEGFGLPVIEAAKFGRRMIVSDGGSLAEIAPPTACVIPLSEGVSAAAASAARYLCSTSSYVDLSGYGEAFSWTSVARSIFREAY